MTRPQNKTVRPMVFPTAMQGYGGTLRLMARRSVNVCRWSCRHARDATNSSPARYPDYLVELLSQSS
ncbi:MAG: hypothetical protein J4F42_15635 [Desulfurellaceae bacterium]|nr:hypothetical protein [Desulfurellaceae bacterium]